MKKRDIITFIVLGVIFLIIFLILYINKNNKQEEAKTEFKELTVVTDETMFLSVSSNINKAFSYVNNNNINLDYVFKNIIKNDYQNMTFEATEMFVVSRLNLYKYYVKGEFYREIMDEPITLLKKGYIILNYDINNVTYSIEIIDEKTYNNAKNIDYIFEEISRNKYNQFEYYNLNNKSKSSLYFNDFTKISYSDPESAYELLVTETKNKYFNTSTDYENFIIKHPNMTIKEYSVNNNTIAIKDNYGNEYIINTNGILKYNVKIIVNEE